MKTGDVISLVTVSGEFVGKWVGETTVSLTLRDPHMVSAGAQGNIGFMPVVCLTGKPKPDTVEFNKTAIVCYVETDENVVREYRKATSGLIV